MLTIIAKGKTRTQLRDQVVNYVQKDGITYIDVTGANWALNALIMDFGDSCQYELQKVKQNELEVILVA